MRRPQRPDDQLLPDALRRRDGPAADGGQVRLHIGCIPTFFGKIANYVTGSHSFECISESANAVAEGWSENPQAPYKFVALLSDGEKQTLRVDTGGRLTVDKGIDVNARAAEWNPNTCQGVLATDPGSAFESCGPVSAPRVSVVGGWSGTPYSLTVGSGPGACSSSHYDATSPPPSDCALNVGAPTFVDPLRSLGGSELLGPPSTDSCELCTTVNVLRIRRDSSTGQVRVWVDSMPPVAVGMKIALRNITLDGSPDHTFDENDYEVQSSGTDSTGNWILLAPPFGQGAVSNVPPLIPVTALSLAQGTATLSTDPDQHGISGGDPIAVKNVDPKMDGSFTADSPLDPSSTSLTYQDPQHDDLQHLERVADDGDRRNPHRDHHGLPSAEPGRRRRHRLPSTPVTPCSARATNSSCRGRRRAPPERSRTTRPPT